MHFVVGTAGHVDHGKTALVRALTGIDCDRLPEEKTRGITIELGFAPWRLDDETTASVVDVPGHERFVRTMVAGASGIDCVVLVVAADDGVMPQTREHLAICELLGVRRGVIAVTKSDLADGDLLGLVEEDVRSATRGTFLEAAEIVRCSATRATGLTELTQAVARACGKANAEARRGPAFLAVDRAFAKAGAGKVVTGTLTRGSLAVGDELEAIRGDVVTSVRVRTLEVHGAPATNVVAASRIAASLRGEDLEAIDRGTVLATPGSVSPTRAIEVSLELLAGGAGGAVEPLGKRTALRVHLGAAAFDVWATLLEEDALLPRPGSRAIARISSAVPFPAFVGQRFVVRRGTADGERTVGGGVVLDPLPSNTRWRRRERPLHYETNDAIARLERLVAESRWAGAGATELLRRMPASDDLPAAMKELARRGAIVSAGERWFSGVALRAVETAVLTELEESHRQKPLALGIAGAELGTRVAPRYRLLAPIALAALVARGTVLEETGGLYRSRAHADAAVALAARQKTLDDVGARFANGGLTPPLDDVACAETGLSPAAFKDAIAELRRAGAIRLVGGLHFATTALAGLREKVRTWFASHEVLTPVEFKELCGGITRKHAIPLLEWLDGEGLTTRRGDARAPGPALARTDPTHNTSR